MLAVVDNAAERPASVLGAKTRGGSGAVRVETVRPGYLFRLRIRLRPDLPKGTLRDWLDLATDHPEQGTLSVPIDAEVR